MSRNIIQICSSGYSNHETDPNIEWLYALCSDGSVWCINTNDLAAEQAWLPVRPIPQGDQDDASS